MTLSSHNKSFSPQLQSFPLGKNTLKATETIRFDFQASRSVSSNGGPQTAAVTTTLSDKEFLCWQQKREFSTGFLVKDPAREIPVLAVGWNNLAELLLRRGRGEIWLRKGEAL